MVEPLEETRSELIFATEPLLSSLRLSIPSSSPSSTLVELDEVEVSNLSSILVISNNFALLRDRSRRESYNYAKGYRSCIPLHG